MKNKNRNKRVILFLFFIVLLPAGFFGFNALAENNLVMNELMYDPEGANTGHSDWIELYNNSPDIIELKKDSFGIIDEKNIALEKDGVHYLNCHKISEDILIKPQQFIILADNKNYFENDYSAVDAPIVDTTLDLSSHGDTVYLSADRCATFFTETVYESSQGANDNGRTLEKINPTEENWQESYIAGGTPGEKNSSPPPPKIYSNKIRINELLPAPSDSEEFVELYNPTEQKEDLSGWILHDASKTGKYVFPADAFIESEDYLVVYKKDFKFALNNSGAESLTLLTPTGKEVSKINYNGSKKDLSYNFDGAGWRWSKFLTPGEENIFNNLPTVSSKKTNKIYVNVYADFSAEGSDTDNDTLKYTWDFGDGHKSYKAKTRHKYAKIGKYTATLKVSDGSEDVITTYDIEVIEFPKLKVKITALSPNPSGKDMGSEYITLKNETKKKINLKDWGIATGWKKLVNHPIREDFKIKAGKSKNLTNEFASSTLNNTKSKIELRDPSGRVIDKVKYEKKDGIPDDAVYEKLKKKWQWNEKQVSQIIEETEETEPETVFPEVLENIEDTSAETTLDISDEEIQANLGKSSINPAWQKKKENKILLASTDSNLKITLPEPQSQVLGASTIHATENYYFFTFPTVPEKHWAIKIWESFNYSINSLLLQF